MKYLSQESVVTSSEESKILWETPDEGEFCFENEEEFAIEISNHLADSSCADSVKSSPKKESNGSQSSFTSPKFTKVFPWITNFLQLCQAEVGRYNIHLLENLMTEYLRLITPSAAVCRLKPNRAAKLKKIMNSTLTLFHFFYSNIRKPLEHSSYFNKMSDLMAIYIDLEIIASSRKKDRLLKIASNITSCLFVFLDRSHDYILNSILKTQYLSKNLELCNLIFSRVLRDSPGRAIDEQTYVRYVLAFKLWKQTIKDNDQKKNIVKLACMKLHPSPNFQESVKARDICGILPNVRKSWSESITMFFMKKKFCVGEMIKSFLMKVNVSEKRGALSSYLTNFDRTFPSNNDTDDSRVLKEEDLVLITNYETLTQYLESKRTAGGVTASDKIEDLDPAWNLPFKKRKSVSVEKEDEEGSKATSGLRDGRGVSYPTPKISIAMIDPKVQSLATSLVAFPPVFDYSVSSVGSLCYEAQPHHCVSEVEQTFPGPPQTDTQILTALVESLPPPPRSSLPIGHHSKQVDLSLIFKHFNSGFPYENIN